MSPDIFISYAHSDDRTPDESVGFVSQIERYLQVSGSQKYGRPLEIFRDTHLASGVLWEKEVFDKLRASWVFVPIFSPSWINSLFCQREWDHYWDEVRHDFIVFNQTRIVPISFELPADFEQLLTDQRMLQVVHRFRNGMPEPEFKRTALALADEITQLLKARDSKYTNVLPRVASGSVARTRNDVSRLKTPPLFFDAVPSYFQDREREQAKIKLFLESPSKRLLRVVGASGNGKTTLIQRVLNDLLSNPSDSLRFETIIVLNAAKPDGVSISSLVSQLSVHLGPIPPLPQVFASSRDGSVEDQLINLLAHLIRGRIIVLIDEFEQLVDKTTRKTSAEGAALIALLLRQLRSPLKLILATVLEPTDLASIVPSLQDRLLVNPLESPHGENLLRERDQSGEVGLRDAPSELLNSACERLGWSPRELEFLYWDLAAHPSTTLPELLLEIDRGLSVGSAAEFFINKTFNQLDPNTQKVAQALGIYGRPIGPDAIEYLLLPFALIAQSLQTSLDLLVDMRLAKRQGSLYYLQPLQRRYVLGQIPATRQWSAGVSELAFCREVLYLRGADYFANTRHTSETEHGRNDLAIALDEFELRCAACDHERAAQLLLDVDVEGLLVPGRYGRLAELHELLLGRLDDPQLRMHSLVRLGIAYYRIGKCTDAVNCYEMALAGAAGKDEVSEAIIRGNLGNCYAEVGRTAHAIRS
jgi:tetratricopeptide (TPR) repeat protein